MSVAPTNLLDLALAFYAAGTAIALASLLFAHRRTHTVAFAAMLIGFLAHTAFIGTICVRSNHPPLTNLPETAAFLSWTILLVALILYVRYHVYAAALFLYPLVLALLLVTSIVGEPFAHLAPALRSSLFTMHVLMTTLGVAGLFVGLSFSLLAVTQDRSLKSKSRGRLWDWIPSLSICNNLSHRALSIGFAVYTIGLLAGIAWSYRMTVALVELHTKQVGAVVAWSLFAILLRVHTPRATLVLSAGAFVAVMVSILGIAHV